MFRNISELLRKFTRSLSFKLSFYAGLIMFIAVVAFAYHTISAQEKTLIDEKIQGALKDSEVIKAAIWNGMMTKDREVIRQIVLAIGKQEGFKEINIYDEKGVLHYTSNEDSMLHVGKEMAGDNNPWLKDVATNTALRYRFFDDGKFLNVVNPLRNTTSCAAAGCHAGPEVLPTLGALEVNLPLHSLRNKLRFQTEETIAFALLLFVLISTIIGLAIIFGVRPSLRKLQDKAGRMARGQYTPQPELAVANDEIGELGRAFEEMSRQINDRTRQLDKSRRMYKELFERVPCYLTVIGKDFSIVRANQAFKDEFGDQVGKQCFAGFKGLKSRCRNCQVEKTFKDGLAHRSEEVWSLGREDRKALVVVNTSPIFDEEGKVAEVLEMSVDVTRLEKLQLELKKKEEQFKNLFENVPCYLTVVDSSFRIAFYNKMFAKDFGECWGKHCYRVYKSRDAKCDNCPVERTFADRESHTSEEVWQQNGQDVHIVLYTAPIADDQGEIVAVMEMATNITELKLLQNELAILGETIAGMSHTVKNILSGLEGGVYVVDSGLRSGREEKVRVGWDMVKKNVEKVSELVKDILYASKERKPDYRECDPGKIILEVHDLYEAKARAKGVELIKDFQLEMGPALLDPNGIHSVLSNLVSNAVTACAGAPAKGNRHVILAGRMKDRKLLLQVTDNGVGMPEEVKQNLFKKFYSTKGAKGTGLGLVVTRKIVEEHGGRIEVASRVGEGTSFSVEIPLKPIEQPQAMKVTAS